MSFLKMILAGLKFNREELGEVGKNEEDTIPAISMILLDIVIVSIIAYFVGLEKGLSDLGFIGFAAFITQFGSSLIGSFLYAIILALIMRLFKVKPSFVGTFRVWGAAIIWAIIGTLVGLILPESLGLIGMAIGIGFWLLFNVTLMIGMVGYTDAKYWQVFLSIAIGFAINFGLAMLYGIIIGLF